jgi:hypothetical protein
MRPFHPGATMTNAAIPERVYRFGGARKLVRGAVGACAGTIVLGVAMEASGGEGGLALAAVAGIVGACTVPIFWFAARQHFRTDAWGLHHRGLMGERTIPWSAVTDLSVYRPTHVRAAASAVVYRVQSFTDAIDIPDILTELEQLRAVVEAATGLRWPER